MITTQPFSLRNGLARVMLGGLLLLSCKVTDVGGPPRDGTGGTGSTDPGSGGAGGDGAGNGGGGDTGAGEGDGGLDVAPVTGDPNQNPDGASASPDAIAGEQALRTRLDALTSHVSGTQVLFINCTVSPCTARLSALTLTAMRDLLVAVSADFQGRIDFVVRQHLDGFTGASYQADVVLGTDHTRAVPMDENALLDDPP